MQLSPFVCVGRKHKSCVGDIERLDCSRLALSGKFRLSNGTWIRSHYTGIVPLLVRAVENWEISPLVSRGGGGVLS